MSSVKSKLSSGSRQIGSNSPGTAVPLPSAEPVAARVDPAPGATADGFRGPQVCTIIGITYRQLDYWARTNLLRPSIADAKGSGSQRLYSYRDLLELKLIKNLIDAGVALQSARTAVEYLRDNLGEDLASANLVLSGDRPLLVRDDGEIIDLIRKGQGVLSVVALSGLAHQIDAAILTLRPARVDGTAAAGPEETRPDRRTRVVNG